MEIRRGDGYDPLMNLAIAAAGHAAEAGRRLRSTDAAAPTGAFASSGSSGRRAFALTQRVTSTITRAADGPLRRFEARGHGDELAVQARRRAEGGSSW